MRDPIILLVHLIATLARLMGPGGLRSVVAESVLVKQPLLMLNRSRHRAPNLCASDRILAGVWALFMRPARVIRSAIVLRPSTILEFHRALRTRKYRWLFSPTRRRTGPQGPSKALVDAIVDMKRRNPRWGCPRIAQQIALAFAVDIDKDVVRRVLATHYRPAPRSGGPSWLTFLGHAKDSLWSIDLFRCESAILRSHWVLVVMDHYTRRIVGFGIHAGTVDGRALCRMFTHAIRGLSRPTRLSSDHDPLSRFHQWRANLRVLQVTEVKSVPYVPLSHPFVERLIGTRRRECVDQLLFWSASDLEDQTGGLPGLLQCASGPCVVGRADARPDTKGCRTARPLPMGRALPWSLSDADRGVTSDQRRRWRAGRRARVRRLSRHSRAVRQLHALLMPSRQRRGGLPAHGTRRSNDVGFLRIRHPQVTSTTPIRESRPMRPSIVSGRSATSVTAHNDSAWASLTAKQANLWTQEFLKRLDQH